MSDLIQKDSTAIDMARMKVVSIIGRLKHYPKSLTVEMRDQAAGVIEEYLARDDERLRSVGNLLEAADKAMAGATTSDAKLMVMANYGDIALGILRGFAEGRPFTPTLTEETAHLKERVRDLELALDVIRDKCRSGEESHKVLDDIDEIATNALNGKW